MLPTAATPHSGRILKRFRLGSALFLGSNAGGNAANQTASRAAIGVSVSLLDGSDPTMTRPIVASKSGATDWEDRLDRPAVSSVKDSYNAAYTAQVAPAEDKLSSIIFEVKGDEEQLAKQPGIIPPDFAITFGEAASCARSSCAALDPGKQLAALENLSLALMVSLFGLRKSTRSQLECIPRSYQANKKLAAPFATAVNNWHIET